MNSFHIIILIVASVSLIVILTMMGILLTKDKQSQKFPTSYSNAPDGWTLTSSDEDKTLTQDETYDTIDGKPTHYGTNPTISRTGSKIQATKTFSITDWDDICKKKIWADQNNVYWDGITTYNGC
jgi:hypothetical protein